MASLTGTSGNDQLNGSSEADLMLGLGGDDSLFGQDGDDRLEGGDGQDQLYGDRGDDLLLGGAGHDWLSDEGGASAELFGESGNDYLHYFEGYEAAITDALLDGGDGDDRLEYFTYDYDDRGRLRGGGGNDSFTVYSGGDISIEAGSGLDVVEIWNNALFYEVSLGSDMDLLALRYQPSPLLGNPTVTVSDFDVGGGDALRLLTYLLSGGLTGWDPGSNPFASGHLRLMQRGADAILQIDQDGAAGSNVFVDFTILSNVNASALGARQLGGYASNGALLPGENISGSASDDLISGTSGDDVISGKGGVDRILGAAGDDIIDGGDGSDVLDGELGNDEIHGGEGDDTVRLLDDAVFVAFVGRETGESAGHRYLLRAR